MSAVFKTRLRPRFIGLLTVVAKKGLAYTLYLPRKVRKHPVFDVGMLKPYRARSKPREYGGARARESALLKAATSKLGRQADPLSKASAVPMSASASVPIPV